jgi:hypothetical protein
MKDVAETNAEPRQYTASELRKLPLHERNAILASTATEAERVYREHPELMDFEAFGEEFFDGDEPGPDSR